MSDLSLSTHIPPRQSKERWVVTHYRPALASCVPMLMEGGGAYPSPVRDPEQVGRVTVSPYMYIITTGSHKQLLNPAVPTY